MLDSKLCDLSDKAKVLKRKVKAVGKDHIRRVSRNDPMFKDRSIIVRSAHSKTVIPVPDQVILCDACNDEIKTDTVNLLVIDGGVWGTVCEGCRLRYHKGLPIKEAVKLNQVQKTLIQQLQAQNPLFMAEFSITNIVLMSENTIRLCSRGREIVNIDITYNRGSDLYDIKAYRLRNHGLEVKTIYDEQGFFWDQLNEAIKTILEESVSYGKG